MEDWKELQWALYGQLIFLIYVRLGARHPCASLVSVVYLKSKEG